MLFTFQNKKGVKTTDVQSKILQTHMHLKSRKSAPNSEDKRGHSMKRIRKWWLITHLTTYKSKLKYDPVRTATAKVDQGYKPNKDPRISHLNL